MKIEELSPKDALKWEIAETQTKISVYRDQIGSDGFKALPPGEQSLLVKCRSVLSQYLVLLKKRNEAHLRLR